MDHHLQPLYEEYASDLNTLGILIMEKTEPNSPVTDSFDVILLIIVKNINKSWYTKHYNMEGKSIALHVVNEGLLMNWIDTSGYRRAVEWIIYGKAVLDKDGYVFQLKNQLRDFPVNKRELRKTIEFGKLVKSYHEAKYLFELSEYKDTYSKILYSLHYLARLAVIEQGYYPEVTVWRQVRQIDLEVYKLYEEFIDSKEEMEKRVKLMLIAMDFIISSRSASSVKHLLNILRTRDSGWSYAELKSVPMVESYSLDLAAIFSYLLDKKIIRSVKEKSKVTGLYEQKYSLGEQ
ncbi:nucleotidyltransferase-like protein [Virgibacillus oceani]